MFPIHTKTSTAVRTAAFTMCAGNLLQIFVRMFRKNFIPGVFFLTARAASFCGAGVDGGAIRFAKEHGADVIVSSDVKHNYICDILESGMRLVVLTHYASENYGFKKIYQKIGDKLGVPAYYHEDGFML